MDHWQTIKKILADLHEDPTLEEQVGLEELCGGDEGVLREVRIFLGYESELDGFIDSPLLTLTDPLCPGERKRPLEPEPEADPHLGELIGPYRVEALLGTGGMGAVYVAQRDQDFEQRVALKVVRRDLVAGPIVESFHRERQILARLEHPHIARLLDGGTTADGAPYFAMELVEGEPIHRYCEQRELSIAERLRLFLPLCSALEAAHRNLVIHRDLKPANILVDGGGMPKLLDFGIANLLDRDRQTSEFGNSLAMTPSYASPEQLRGERLGTASDIYSLGVVLFRVLTGALPHTEIESSKLASGSVVLDPDVSASVPSSALRGDVDAILAKALHTDPLERYGTADQLAQDLRRHLDGHPVEARPSTLWYRSSKFVRRHRWAVANAVIAALVAIGFTVALWHQLRETERSRDRAQQISSFVVDLFQSASPHRPGGKEPTVRDLLDRGRGELESAFQDEPQVRAHLLMKVGEVYVQLGDYDLARELLEESLALLRRWSQDPHGDLATVLSDLAAVAYQTGDLGAAESFLRESLDLRRHLGDRQDLTKPSNNLASILMARGRFSEAEAIYRESLVARRQWVLEEPGDEVARQNLAISLRSLATALVAGGDLDAAEPLLQESLMLRREIYGDQSPRVATVLLSLGRLDHQRQRLTEARAWARQGLTIRRQALGEDHLHTALARLDLARILVDVGEVAAAEELLISAARVLAGVRSPEDEDLREAQEMLTSLRLLKP